MTRIARPDTTSRSTTATATASSPNRRETPAAHELVEDLAACTTVAAALMADRLSETLRRAGEMVDEDGQPLLDRVDEDGRTVREKLDEARDQLRRLGIPAEEGPDEIGD